ncbi:MAG: copper transporter [Mycobacterium sp.]
MNSSRRRFVLSLAAVFLALAVGVVLGARVLSGPKMSGLLGDSGNLKKQVEVLTEENSELSDILSAASDFDKQMSDRIVHGALAGKSAVVIKAPDADNTDVDEVISLIGQAGGSVTGTIGLTQQFVDATASEKLRSLVNSPIVPAGTQLNTGLVDESAQAGDLLGSALLINRDPKIAPVSDDARDAVLTALRDTGFLTYTNRFGAADTAVVITGGALAEDAGNQGATVARFAAGLAPHGSGTVLAGRDGSATGVAALAVNRADPALSGAVTTVDDIDAESGRITAILALQRLIGGAPAGKYGVGDGATSITVPK